MLTKNILEDKLINVSNYEHHIRDFTYIDDIAEVIIRVTDRDLNRDGKNLFPNKTKFSLKIYNPNKMKVSLKIYNIVNNPI
ncbi:hypothetical protein ACT3TH_05285 [Psychrobacter sp. AOP22-C1-C5]|uniref:hypothetical protein n=1 Tax=Psychrobacter sp. AOP22-C1-C5 TaxID=3457716 RepID=UPI00403628B4